MVWDRNKSARTVGAKGRVFPEALTQSALAGGGGGVWGNFWVYVSRAFCLEKILYFLNFFNSIKMQEIIEIISKIKK